MPDVDAPLKFSSSLSVKAVLNVFSNLLINTAIFVYAEDGQLLCWGWNKYGQV